MNKDIVVSVCMITYNHDNYIREAIEGVLMQKTDFPIELIIGEDCSLDSTRSIVSEYTEKFPDKIYPILHDLNVGMMKNFIGTLEVAKGKYIAICEGDDYWIDPYKLQKQVDFLEANPDFTVCFTESELLINGKLTHDDQTINIPDITDINYLIYGNYIRTNTVLFRKNEKIIAELNTINSPVGDFSLHMLNAKHGKIKKLTDITGVYRIGNGIWSSMDDWSVAVNTFLIYAGLTGHFSHKLNSEIENIYLNKLAELFKYDINEEKIDILLTRVAKYKLDKQVISSIIERYIIYKRERNSVKWLVRRLFHLTKSRIFQ